MTAAYQGQQQHSGYAEGETQQLHRAARRQEQDARLMDYQWYAALAYVRANRLNHNVIESAHDRFGIIASGKAFNDTRQALVTAFAADTVTSALASPLVDLVLVVTDDNPRSEDPAAIRKAVRQGCPGAQEIGDRRAAIRQAIEQMRDGDVVVIAGKGHEQGQIVGGVTHPFDDAAEAAEALRLHA